MAGGEKEAMLRIRQPAVAGSFYPRDDKELRHMLSRFLATETAAKAEPRAIIAPHAGYVYSGPIAGTAYTALLPLRGRIHRVALFGPSHRVAFDGIAVSSADAFRTPLGEVPLDRTGVDAVLELPFVQLLDEAHEQEHGLEVHLPFLQEVLDDFQIVPMVVGNATAAQVEAAIECVTTVDENPCFIVISSDLSHYYDYAKAQELDAATSRSIEGLRPEEITHEQACGRIPIQGLLGYARKHGLHAETLDLRNSGDTAGSRAEVVGYGAYVFT